MKIHLTFLILLVCISLTGCNDGKPITELKPITLAELYPGDVKSIDQIELVDGSSGESKTVSNNEEIKTIIKNIKDIKLIPDTNQEGRTGWLFRLKFYEKSNVKLDFTPHHMNGIYYENNSELTLILKQLYKEKFGREF
ncbi:MULTISPECIES: hypothetical protein [Paenibacillus]|jgi:hypothetical protein|uniref:Lipoprotein n=1 Tax=Paenibacillus barengoltzii J12 TaxID=935846 RepID=A0ABY1M3K5_9BACL|nr:MULTISPECIES: hypothetical protein [Paenibacillus]MDU0328954.1 hypothetical protein [Paenibacillus sp. 3LSP]MEC2344000.1 hypothetical protein [Paenibacillus barengoltzii]SMF68322.1 hypothetical protein SAMN02744102_04510 [Paenibacillus barengoltzii]SMF69380.1 hypothetical protein SAMN02744124_04398 [Paenibacillus barengoltzii J12]